MMISGNKACEDSIEDVLMCYTIALILWPLFSVMSIERHSYQTKL
jgi:hypothetical protein